ncbi:hypothetical protein H312_01423, partial [Anncaliia algerae PRA339]
VINYLLLKLEIAEAFVYNLYPSVLNILPPSKYVDSISARVSALRLGIEIKNISFHLFLQLDLNQLFIGIFIICTSRIRYDSTITNCCFIILNCNAFAKKINWVFFEITLVHVFHF